MKNIVYSFVLIPKGTQKFTDYILNFCRRKYYNCYLRFFKATLYNTVSFVGKCILQIKNGAQIKIGENFRVYSGFRFAVDNTIASKIVVLNNAKLTIGDNCGISNTILWCRKEIQLGNYVNIGAGTFIFDNNFHSTDWKIRMTETDADEAKSASVIIKDHAFIGARCIICKGVTIGAHSMVAAGSVVVHDVPDNEIWGGNPAVFIKSI